MIQDTGTDLGITPARHAELREQLIRLIVESGDGGIGPQDLAATGGSLSDLGYSSISYMRLIDAIENDLGVYIDPEADIKLFATVDSILGLVVEGLAGSGG
jgi:acyl carrier protein